MTDIRALAETMATEFTAAVQASVKAYNLEIANIMAAAADATAERNRGLAEVRRLRRQAAEMTANADSMADTVEDHFYMQSRDIEARLNALRAPPAAAAPPLESPSNVRALASARQA